MLSARPHSHRFSAPVVIAPAPAQDPVISFGAQDRAIVAWKHTECSTLEPAPGEPYARVLLGGSFGPSVALDAGSYTTRVVPVAATGGGGSVSWITTLGALAPSTLTATADASGRFSPAAAPREGLAPVASDAAGDTALADLPHEEPSAVPLASGSATSASPVAVQPAGGGALEPSPLRWFAGAGPTPSFAFFATATASAGRGVALAWQTRAGAASVATWRP